jgi:tRNA pseudouridine(55) synthase
MITELWKPYGITSTQFVKEYQEKIKCNKATCTGRLDPLAQGALMILTDEDTKKMSSFLKKDKIYKFDMILGLETESHDCLSKIVNNYNETQDILKNMDSRFIIEKMHEFISRYTKQKFPLVSSFVTKHDYLKKPLWWFYKNGYKNVSLPEKSIKVNYYNVLQTRKETGKILSEKFMNRIEQIKNVKLQNDLNTEETIFQWKNYNQKNKEFIVVSMEMSVSTGFYIRRFCHDFGKFIGTNGIAFDITRTKIVNE